MVTRGTGRTPFSSLLGRGRPRGAGTLACLWGPVCASQLKRRLWVLSSFCRGGGKGVDLIFLFFFMPARASSRVAGCRLGGRALFLCAATSRVWERVPQWLGRPLRTSRPTVQPLDRVACCASVLHTFTLTSFVSIVYCHAGWHLL